MDRIKAKTPSKDFVLLEDYSEMSEDLAAQISGGKKSKSGDGDSGPQWHYLWIGPAWVIRL